MTDFISAGSVDKTEYVEKLMADEIQDTWADHRFFGRVNPYYYNDLGDIQRTWNLTRSIVGTLILYALEDENMLDGFTHSEAIHALGQEAAVARNESHLVDSKGRQIDRFTGVQSHMTGGMDILHKSDMLSNLGVVADEEEEDLDIIHKVTPKAKKLLKKYPEMPFTVMPANAEAKGCAWLLSSVVAVSGVLVVDQIGDYDSINSTELLITGLGGAIGVTALGYQIAQRRDARRAHLAYEMFHSPPTDPKLKLA